MARIVAAPPRVPVDLTPAKGERGGLCNRTVCSNQGAQWFNRSTEKYYCGFCADLINRANADDAQRLYNGPLCVQAGDTASAE